MAEAIRNGRREQRPAFQFYAQDFLASDSVAQMTHEEVGIYTLLLCRAWVGPGLPNDLSRIARMIGVTEERCRELFEGPLGECWVERGGRLVNPRQEREREIAEAKTQKRAEAGRRGGLAKAAAVVSTSVEREVGVPARSNATPLPEQSPGKGDGMGWDGIGISSGQGEPEGEAPPDPAPERIVRRVVERELEPVPADVQADLDRWAVHRREIGKPLGRSSVRALLREARKDPPAFARRVKASVESATTVLLEDPEAKATRAAAPRLTAHEQAQERRQASLDAIGELGAMFAFGASPAQTMALPAGGAR